MRRHSAADGPGRNGRDPSVERGFHARWLVDHLLGRANQDPRARGGVLAAAFFGTGTLVVLGTVWLLHPSVDRTPIVVLALAGIAVDVVILVLPWSRWPPIALVVPALAAYVLLALGGVLEENVLPYYTPLYTVSFVYLGLVTAPGTPTVMVPVATASYLIGNSADLRARLASLAIAAPLWLLVGEVLARLRRQGREQTDAERKIRRVASEIRRHMDLDELVATAVDEIANAVAADRVFIRLLEDGEHAVTSAEWHATGVESMQRVVPGPTPAAFAPLVEQAFRERRIVVINDTERDQRLGPDARMLLRQLDCRAMLDRSLVEGEDRLGMLILHRVAPRAWTDTEVGIVDAIGRELATAISQARAYALRVAMVQRLQELDQAKTDFVSSVSHELRTPLTSIMGYLEILIDGDAGMVSAEQQKMLETIERNGERLTSLIEDLLTMSRMESGTFRLEVGDVDVVQLVDGVREAITPLADSGGLELEVHVPANVGTIEGDAAQLERVLLNLAGNAVKFTPSGGKVQIEVSRSEKDLRFVVEDNGIGIPLDEQERLFSRFFRSSISQQLSVQGTGLGLSIAKNVVDRHGGKIEVQSAPGVGSTFTVTLPIRAADRTEEEVRT